MKINRVALSNEVNGIEIEYANSNYGKYISKIVALNIIGWMGSCLAWLGWLA